MEVQSNLVSEPKRKYLSNNFDPNDLQVVEEHLVELRDRNLNSADELRSWLLDYDEFIRATNECARWKFINSSIDTTNPEFKAAVEHEIKVIGPKTKPYFNALNKKFIESPFLQELDADEYFIIKRTTQKRVEIYREENIALYTDLGIKEKQYSELLASMCIEWNGEELTLQQANKLQKNKDRAIREKAFRKVNEQRLKHSQKLDKLFSELVQLRHQIALNAGFENFVDYQFAALSRFDYTRADCSDFHDAIQTVASPVFNNIYLTKQEKLGYESLRPWDTEVDESGLSQVAAFSNQEELVNNSINCLTAAHPFFGECLTTMKEMNRLDLESRKGKSPGGYNCSLSDTGVPFIFMNSVGSIRDVRTILHEMGHAVHSFLSHDLNHPISRRYPSEVAELAAMAMEFIGMEHWKDTMFFNDEDLKQARKFQIENPFKLFPWVALVDKFQHWIYTNPTHTIGERSDKWVELYDAFMPNSVNYEGLEDIKRVIWHKQKHIFERPFYYIEYALAYLGAVAIWRNYLSNKDQTIAEYKAALSLGNTKSIGEIYEAAGIKFSFNKEYITELIEFLTQKSKEV